MYIFFIWGQNAIFAWCKYFNYIDVYKMFTFAHLNNILYLLKHVNKTGFAHINKLNNYCAYINVQMNWGPHQKDTHKSTLFRSTTSLNRLFKTNVNNNKNICNKKKNNNNNNNINKMYIAHESNLRLPK